MRRKEPIEHWSEIIKQARAMPTRSRCAMEKASDRGWFFSWQGSLKAVNNLITQLETVEDEEIDNILSSHYTAYLPAYTSALTSSFPARKIAIDAAVYAHNMEDADGFYLSIPVFLAQADGLFSELSKTESPLSIKSSKGGKAAVQGLEWIKNKIGNNQRPADLLDPLFQLHLLDLLKSTGARKTEFESTGKVFSALNRHQILHGEVSDYGTEINSLKAFSFLVFMGLHIPSVLSLADDSKFGSL